MLHVPPGTDFLTRAQMLKAQYALADPVQWLHEDIREVAVQTLKEPPTDSGPQPASTPWFTSFGVLDHEGGAIVPEHGEIKVDNVYA